METIGMLELLIPLISCLQLPKLFVVPPSNWKERFVIKKLDALTLLSTHALPGHLKLECLVLIEATDVQE